MIIARGMCRSASNSLTSFQLAQEQPLHPVDATITGQAPAAWIGGPTTRRIELQSISTAHYSMDQRWNGTSMDYTGGENTPYPMV